MIREDEPPAPSTRISKLGADGEKIASHRSSDAGSLSRFRIQSQVVELLKRLYYFAKAIGKELLVEGEAPRPVEPELEEAAAVG